MKYKQLVLIALIFPVLAHGDFSSHSKRKLLKIIKEQCKETALYTGISTLDPSIEEALDKTPREKFIPSYQRDYAYENRPLSIGYGQTISQPYIVALMTQLLSPTKEQKILEVGTGSGYQAAILSHLVKEVHSIEIIPQLAKRAKKTISKLGYQNIFITIGDGHDGISEEAPFDGIIVTAAADHIPPPLIKQLKVGGKMIIPVGGVFQIQNLILVEKTSEGVKSKNILPVRFVPLTR